MVGTKRHLAFLCKNAHAALRKFVCQASLVSGLKPVARTDSWARPIVDRKPELIQISPLSLWAIYDLPRLNGSRLCGQSDPIDTNCSAIVVESTCVELDGTKLYGLLAPDFNARVR